MGGRGGGQTREVDAQAYWVTYVFSAGSPLLLYNIGVLVRRKVTPHFFTTKLQAR